MTEIGIIDVGIGNLGSLRSAIFELGFDSSLIKTSEALSQCESIILPGVGSFDHGMRAIEEAKLTQGLVTHALSGKPILGICLGMQILFDRGEEGNACAGLGILPGVVRRLKERPEFHIPHIGWNEVTRVGSHVLWQGIKLGVDFYFVHSYRVECDSEYVFGTTNHGEYFPSFVGMGNVVGVQFHPEKSQRSGLRLLENFCSWDGKC